MPSLLVCLLSARNDTTAVEPTGSGDVWVAAGFVGTILS